MQSYAFSWLDERQLPWDKVASNGFAWYFVWAVVVSLCSYSNHSIFLFLIASGYHVSSSLAIEDAKWESRHLLQEVYDNESKLYSDPEKNCTEPGKTGKELSWKNTRDRSRKRKGVWHARNAPESHYGRLAWHYKVCTFRLLIYFLYCLYISKSFNNYPNP